MATDLDVERLGTGFLDLREDGDVPEEEAPEEEAPEQEAPDDGEALLALVRLVEADDLFDEAFYAREASAAGSRSELVTHYLTAGEAALQSPSPEFDLRFYREFNPDVASSGGSPLLHYLRHGRSERRYPTRRQLEQDAALIVASGLFDAHAYSWDRGRPARRGLSDVEDYLVGRNRHAPTGDAFHSDFYVRMYDDALDGYAMPILHYIAIGRAQFRVCNEYQLNQQMQIARLRFNERTYLDQFRRRFPNQPTPSDPLQHYILVGRHIELDPAPDFCADYYLRLYPDMRVCGMDPFHHYAGFGHSEGRVGRPDFTPVISRGGMAFDSRKPTIMVASHEASRTGVPLLGLNLNVLLAETHNVVTYLGKTGPLLRDFTAQSCSLVTGPLSTLDAEYLMRELRATHGLTAVLLNSVETSELAQAALQADLPSVALVHEFAEYTRPVGRMSDLAESVDRVIVPASLIEESVQAELLFTRSSAANHILVRPQGCFPSVPQDTAIDDLTRDEILAWIGADATDGGKVKIVLGAGYVQIRKGVDLFVQTAAELRRLWGDNVRFVWVGDGYAPKSDMQFSVWVEDMVRRLELEGHMFFLPVQSRLDALFALSDVFYLPSRLDPFPNVALEAFQAGRAVVCFDRATGIVDALRDAPGRKAAVGAAVGYGDVTQAAEALIRMFKPAEAKRALGNAALMQRAFDFRGYIASIAEELAAAATLRDAAIRTVDQILQAGRFDAAFHDHAAAPVRPAALRAAIRTYVARGQKGLLRHNPCPGVNEGAARGRLALPGPALGAADTSPTHRCVVLRGGVPAVVQDGAGLRAALHLHLHYSELAAEFATRLSAARAPRGALTDVPLDLILTTTSDARRVEVEYAFRGYKGGSTRLIVAPNRGRDIGPFLTTVGGIVQAGRYDVVGHLHAKRSLAVDAALGDRWRSFLLDTLLGGEAGLPAVLSLFERDPALGLVFAEDRHCVGWGKNRPAAAALAARMQPSPSLPEWPVFPIGTMFWARPAALLPLWALELGPPDFPAEPAPYDGTLLHAVERMLPSVCEASGHGWCTVHREGSGW